MSLLTEVGCTQELEERDAAADGGDDDGKIVEAAHTLWGEGGCYSSDAGGVMVGVVVRCGCSNGEV